MCLRPPLGGHQIGSRHPYGLGYASQREDRRGRAQLEVYKLYAALGAMANGWEVRRPSRNGCGRHVVGAISMGSESSFVVLSCRRQPVGADGVTMIAGCASVELSATWMDRARSSCVPLRAAACAWRSSMAAGGV